jgi:hypothetical protein
MMAGTQLRVMMKMRMMRMMMMMRSVELAADVVLFVIRVV